VYATRIAGPARLGRTRSSAKLRGHRGVLMGRTHIERAGGVRPVSEEQRNYGVEPGPEG
jgi:hypothetical protein